MSASVRTKAGKKQSPLSENKQAEEALLALEEVCFSLLEGELVDDPGDADSLLWQRRIKSIVNPVSLAVSECRGPKHFHNHYRHSKKDDAVLEPVLAPPFELLAQACENALSSCQSELVGMPEARLVKAGRRLEQALRDLLSAYQAA